VIDAREDAYVKAWEQVDALVRAGHSWSGNERNNCFLNMGDGRFADVSSVAGFDLSVDGRSLALVDWDHDGDLDLWMTNRTGPRLRFLRNELPSDNRHVAFQLEGRSCNRDAIGARVELHCSGEGKPPLIKTLRAGEGYLGQSSKWLHFGLGLQDEPERIVVRWPGGPAEEFRGLQANSKYRLVQQSGAADLWKPPARPAHPKTSDPVVGVPDSRAGVLLSARLPLMSLDYVTFEGKTEPVPVGDSRLTLVNLWAAWCAPCRVELTDFSRHHQELSAAGLNVVALSTDGFDAEDESDREAAKKLLDGLEFPFVAGDATEELVEQLEIIYRELFHQPDSLPLPTSFLLDAEGRLAAVYCGPVEADQLISDARTLASGNGSLPFPGRWLAPPAGHNLFRLVWTMLEKGFMDEAMEYIERHEALLVRYHEYHKLLALAGNGQLARGQARQAAELYRKALKIVPDYVEAQNNLGWLLATHPDDEIRNGEEALSLAESVVQRNDQVPWYLDTLSAAYAEVGRFPEAVATAKKGVQLASSQGHAQLAKSIETRLRNYESAKPWRDK